MQPISLVTGGSYHSGSEITQAAFERGKRMVAAACDPQAVVRAQDEDERLLLVALDVTHQRQADAATDAAQEQS